MEREQLKYNKAPQMCGTIEERCLSGLEHVTHGLDCFRYFPTDDCNDEEQKKAEKYSACKKKNKQKKRKKVANVYPSCTQLNCIRCG